MMEEMLAVNRRGLSNAESNSTVRGSAVTLTPGRTRNIAQDMEALRLSRQDNPYIRQLLASRESLVESSNEDCEADDAVLMNQEFCNTSIDLLAEDPLTLKEVHDHLIRSPPPIAYWPHESLSPRASSAFDFTGNTIHSISYSALSINNSEHGKDFSNGGMPRKSPVRVTTKIHSEDSYLHGDYRTNLGNNNPSKSRPISPRARDTNLMRPLSLPGESHLKNALNRSRQHNNTERFSLLHHPVPLRISGSNKFNTSEDSEHLVSDTEK